MNSPTPGVEAKKACSTPTILRAVAFACLFPCGAMAEVTVFFNEFQIATQVATGTTSDTISSEGYLFTYTRDKLFTGGLGTNPIGRAVRIPWPQGVESQYVTEGPTLSKAEITIQREDGHVFDLTAFTAHLLANAGAGRSIEIVPLLNGDEPLPDPLYFDVSGNYGNEFSYDTSPNPLGSTAALTNYDTYVIALSLDFALTALTLESIPPPTNHAPTDLEMSNSAVLENELPGTTVGTLSTIDPDVGDAFSYALVMGVGSGGNGSFVISGGDLLTTTSFNYEVQSDYSIRVESTDQGFLSTQKVFSVTVLDVNEAPVFFGPDPPHGSNVVIRWSSLTNHFYTLYVSTNLVTGFSILESNIIATPAINTYTDSFQDVPAKFWKVTTEP